VRFAHSTAAGEAQAEPRTARSGGAREREAQEARARIGPAMSPVEMYDDFRPGLHL
jgi:hypothetical protein